MGRHSIFTKQQNDMALAAMASLEMHALSMHSPHKAFPLLGEAAAFPNNARRGRWFKNGYKRILQVCFPDYFIKTKENEWDYLDLITYKTFKQIRDSKNSFNETTMEYVKYLINEFKKTNCKISFETENLDVIDIAVPYVKNILTKTKNSPPDYVIENVLTQPPPLSADEPASNMDSTKNSLNENPLILEPEVFVSSPDEQTPDDDASFSCASRFTSE